MLRKSLVRLVLISLAFASVCASLATRPGSVLDFWYLYYCPVLISALSFGLRGALLGSGTAALSTAILLYRFQELLALAARDVTLRIALLVGVPGPGLREAVQYVASTLGSGEAAAQTASVDLSGDFAFSVLKVGLGSLVIAAIACLVGWQWDRQREHELMAERQALTDGLTGLANYRALMEGLESGLITGRAFGLLFIDVDNMKAINDHHGHPVGDKALVHLAALLRQTTRPGDLITRNGGDEFAVALLGTQAADESTSLETALTVAQRLLETAEATPLTLPDGQKLPIRLSIGVAAYPTHGERTSELVSVADMALYAAKRAGGHQSVVGSPK